MAYPFIDQVIKLDGTLSNVENVQIQTYSSTSITALSDVYGNQILPTISFGTLVIDYSSVQPTSINSTLTFGLPQLNALVYAQSIESTVAFGDGDKFTLYIVDQPISSTLSFGLSQLNSVVYANSITTELSIGTHKVSALISPQSIDSGLAFGALQLNQKLYSGTITSGIEIPSPNLLKIIGPLSIATTANFGTATFIDNIHRMLVFKNDNISKIGDNDAGVVAGGIRINPSTAIAENAIAGDFTLPNKAAGFVSVNIAGKDYLMPFFNA